MGFGSYDESEQENQQRDDEDDGESVSVSDKKHDGEVEYANDADSEELLDQLQEIKSDE